MLSTSIYDLVLLDVCHFGHHQTHTFLSNHCDSSVLSRLSRYSCLYLGSRPYMCEPRSRGGKIFFHPPLQKFLGFTPLSRGSHLGVILHPPKNFWTITGGWKNFTPPSRRSVPPLNLHPPKNFLDHYRGL